VLPGEQSRASAAVTPKLLALKITASALAMVSHCLQETLTSATLEELSIVYP